MRIGLAQINATLGDFKGNKQKILDFVARAHDQRCDIVVFPEAALFGYHPADLLERPSLVAQQEKELADLHKRLPTGVAVLVGAFVRNKTKRGKGFWNVAALLQRGKKPKYFAKQLLPTYDVFDESRHVEQGRVAKNTFRFRGRKILVTICEDIWAWPLPESPYYSSYRKNPLKEVPPKNVDLVLNLSASPFTPTKAANRQVVCHNTSRLFRAPMVYVNMVGAQDELIFDGGSFALSPKGEVIAECARFAEDLNVVDLEKPSAVDKRKLKTNKQEILRSALVLGMGDFLKKTSFQRVHLGLSGGIDSALVACLAVDTIGRKNVTAVYMSGPFSAPESEKWARQLARNLDIQLLEIPISRNYEMLLSELESSFGQKPFDVMNENLQARVRGVMLMAFANRFGSLLLGTSNKSELAVGYSTLYGDMTGGLLPIGDLLKTEVNALAEYYNRDREVIPQGILDRPPSAELRPNQKDQDSLPPYAELDKIISKLVLGFKPPTSKIEHQVLEMMMKSEFKRWQAPPVLKVSDHAFGRGRRFPVAHRAKE